MKKAMLQLQESILVTLVIVIIIGLGLFVFYKFTINSLDKSKYELEQNRVFTLISTIQNNPLVSYSNLGDEQNALDTSKLINANLTNLGFKEITVKQVYPLNNVSCNKNNYPDCGSYVVYNKKLKTLKNVEIISTPISIYFPLTNEYKAGLIEIKWYY